MIRNILLIWAMCFCLGGVAGCTTIPEYQTDANGNLILDEDGNPIPHPQAGKKVLNPMVVGVLETLTENIPGIGGAIAGIAMTAYGVYAGTQNKKNKVLAKAREEVSAVVMEVVNRVQTKVSKAIDHGANIATIPGIIKSTIVEEVKELKKTIFDPDELERILENINDILKV